MPCAVCHFSEMSSEIMRQKKCIFQISNTILHNRPPNQFLECGPHVPETQTPHCHQLYGWTLHFLSFGYDQGMMGGVNDSTMPQTISNSWVLVMLRSLMDHRIHR